MKQSVGNLRAIVNAAETQAVNVQSFLKIVTKYTEPTELTPTILRGFVENVVVHAPDKSSGHRVQRIDVYYTFISQDCLRGKPLVKGGFSVSDTGGQVAKMYTFPPCKTGEKFPCQSVEIRELLCYPFIN